MGRGQRGRFLGVGHCIAFDCRGVGRWGDVHNEGNAVHQGLGQLANIGLDDMGVLSWMPADAEQKDIPENLFHDIMNQRSSKRTTFRSMRTHKNNRGKDKNYEAKEKHLQHHDVHDAQNSENEPP